MTDDKELYDVLSMLDRLEEVREDLLEIEAGERPDDDELREEMRALGVASAEDVERRIAELNAQIDLGEGPERGVPEEETDEDSA